MRPLARALRAATGAAGLAGLVIGGTGLVLGAAGGRSWVLDLFAHVRLQETALLAWSTGLLAATGRRREAVAAGLALGCAAATVAPLHLDRPAPAAPGAPALDLVSFNVEAGNATRGAVAEQVAALDADVVFLQEAGALAEPLRGRGGPLQVVHPAPGADSDSVVVLSRLPGTRAAPLDLGGGRTSVEVTVPHDGGEVALLGVHLLPPVRAGWAAGQRELARATASWAAARPGPTVVIGDLNATPWSAAFRRLSADGDLRGSQRGFGASASWTAAAAPWLSLPIDHVLHSPELTTLSRATGPHHGSDHRLLRVRLARAASPA